MNTVLEDKKKELIKKIEASEDLNVIEDILRLLDVTYRDSFDVAFANGYTPEQARNKTLEYIKTLPWKK